MSEIVTDMPILPIQNRVLFPHCSLQVNVGRPNSVQLVESFLAKGKTLKDAKGLRIGVVARVDTDTDEWDVEDIPGTEKCNPKVLGSQKFYRTGVLSEIISLKKADDTSLYQYVMTLKGLQRLEIKNMVQDEPFFCGHVELLEDEIPDVDKHESMVAKFRKQLFEVHNMAKTKIFSQLHRNADTKELSKSIANSIRYAPAEHLADAIVGNIQIPIVLKVDLLEELDATKRLNKILGLVQYQIENFEVIKGVKEVVEEDLKTARRKHLLKKQMEVIRKELGEENDEVEEMEELANKIEELPLTAEARKIVKREQSRLNRLQPTHPEYNVLRSHLELISELPWEDPKPGDIDVVKARKILDDDHFGLEDVKKRLLEYLAVCSLKGNFSAPILCIVGPPGVGKTSLGRSIARALDRPFYRLSLGGVRDESEIRGHRRTYIGAMPGQIIQAMQRVGRRDPVILLDEIDKLSKDVRGDPASAFLEVLDPAQNHLFKDNYVGMPFDLSKVVFIATANVKNTIPPPLLDRMELIDLAGYSPDEKVKIASGFLLPKQMEDHVLTSEHMTVPDDRIRKIIKDYTREAGVRNLDRALGAVCRNVALKLVNHKASKPETAFQHIHLTDDMTEDILGPVKFAGLQLPRTLPVGVSMGLAWTPVGGEVLIIESLKMPGTGNIRLTGSLGDVMKESVFTALSWIRSHNLKVKKILELTTGLDISLAGSGNNNAENMFSSTDLHVHFPSGAVPKDGPSAGVAIVAAITSLLSGCPARRDTAMTGEISLRGAVLPVGGIKEKLLAAHAAGVTRIVLPAENEKDLKQLEEGVRNSMSIFLVSKIEDALEHIFHSSNAGGDLKTSLGTDIIDSLTRKQPGVNASRSDNAMAGIDSCHHRLVSML